MRLHSIRIAKRPTLRAREAEKKLLPLLGHKKWDSSVPLPTVRSLGEQWGVSYATISRLFQRLVREGLVRQHPHEAYGQTYATDRWGFMIISSHQNQCHPRSIHSQTMVNTRSTPWSTPQATTVIHGQSIVNPQSTPQQLRNNAITVHFKSATIQTNPQTTLNNP